MKNRLILNNEIYAAILELKKNINQERPMTTKEAADFLSIRERRLRDNIETFNIPHYKAKSGKLYFYRSELNDWIRSEKILQDKANEITSNLRKAV
jgi:flagellar basal body rod protein FlgB